MKAKSLKDAIEMGMCMGPTYKLQDRLLFEVSKFLIESYTQHLKELKKSGQPFETADYQIREFLEKILPKWEVG